MLPRTRFSPTRPKQQQLSSEIISSTGPSFSTQLHSLIAWSKLTHYFHRAQDYSLKALLTLPQKTLRYTWSNISPCTTTTLAYCARRLESVVPNAVQFPLWTTQMGVQAEREWWKWVNSCYSLCDFETRGASSTRSVSLYYHTPSEELLTSPRWFT